MRKITELAVDALYSRENFKLSNTEVTYHGNVGKMYLHNNLIAKYSSDCILSISNAGWSSNTTKERLNGLLQEYGSKLFIFQKDFTWYIGKDRKTAKEFPYNTFVEITE